MSHTPCVKIAPLCPVPSQLVCSLCLLSWSLLSCWAWLSMHTVGLPQWCALWASYCGRGWCAGHNCLFCLLVMDVSLVSLVLCVRVSYLLPTGVILVACHGLFPLVYILCLPSCFGGGPIPPTLAAHAPVLSHHQAALTKLVQRPILCWQQSPPQYSNARKPQPSSPSNVDRLLAGIIGQDSWYKQKFMEYLYWGRQHCHLLSPVIRSSLRTPRKNFERKKEHCNKLMKDSLVLQQQTSKQTNIVSSFTHQIGDLLGSALN